MGILDSIKNAFSSEADTPATPVESPDTPASETDAAETVTAKTVATETNTESAAQTYTVQSGDTLWRISEKIYGDGSRYMKIFEANTDLLDSPDRIHPGQELVIPEPSDP